MHDEPVTGASALAFDQRSEVFRQHYRLGRFAEKEIARRERDLLGANLIEVVISLCSADVDHELQSLTFGNARTPENIMEPEID